jgi:hypothetical protein
MNRVIPLSRSLFGSIFAAVMLAVSSIVVAEELGGNNYAVSWFSVDAGAGTATGGSYRVQGTIGQADADPLHPATAGPYELVGGFWAVPATIPEDALFSDGFELP